MEDPIVTTNPDNSPPYDPLQPIDANSLRLDSLVYLLLDHWIDLNIVEVPSARLPLKTAYTFYVLYCNKDKLPCVTIQAFNRVLRETMSYKWPSARQRRTARGFLYYNLTLRAWAPERVVPPRGELPSENLTPCLA